jgi:hypothetical protein
MDSEKILMKQIIAQGLRVRVASSGRGYIILCRMKKAMNNPDLLSDDVCNTFKRNSRDFATRERKIEKMIERLDSIPTECLERLYQYFEEYGVEDFFKLMVKLPMSKLQHLERLEKKLKELEVIYR